MTQEKKDSAEDVYGDKVALIHPSPPLPLLFDVSYFYLIRNHARHSPGMDAAIDQSDAAKALDLSNIRFQLMYITENYDTSKMEANVGQSLGRHDNLSPH